MRISAEDAHNANSVMAKNEVIGWRG